MKAALHIGLLSTLVLAVLFVPLAHSAHFHEGDGHTDASMSATCVVCHTAGTHVAEHASPVSLTAVAPGEGTLAAEPTPERSSILRVTRASRAPPSSLS